MRVRTMITGILPGPTNGPAVGSWSKSAPFVLVVVAIVDSAVRIWSSSNGWPNPSLFGVLTRLLLIAVGGIVILSLRERVSVAKTSLGLLTVWVATIAVSLAAHRSANDSIGATVVSISTFGIAPVYPGPSARHMAGVDNGVVILVLLLVACVGPSIHRAIPETWRLRRWSPKHDTSGSKEERPSPKPLSRAVRWTALCVSAGLISFSKSVFDLFARQHVERALVDVETGAVRLSGPLLPTFLWTMIAAGCLGILILAPIVVGTNGRPRNTVWPVAGVGSILPAIWIVALALWVRIGTLLTVAPTRTDGGDPLFYHVTANLLAQGRGFPEPLNFIAHQRWIPSALHGPAYPIVLSLSSRLGGTTFFDHKILSILIGTAVVALTMVLAHRISPPSIRRSTTLISGLLAAVYPNLWLVDGVLFPEGLMALLTVIVVICAYSWWQRPRYAVAGLLGAVTAASALTRGEGLLLTILLIVPLVLGARSLRFEKRLLHLVIAGIACVGVLAPWSIRNARSFEVFVPLSTNGNELFVYANCPPAYEGKFLGFWLFQCQEDLRQEFGEPEGDEAQKALHWRERGLTYARDNAGDLPRVLAARVGRQWDLFRPWQNTDFAPIEGRNKNAARGGLLLYYAMIPFAVAGLAALRRARTRLLPIGAVFASVTFTAAYAYGTTRFRVPFEPFLCLLAAVGASLLGVRLRRRWSSSDEHVSANVLGRAERSTFVQGRSVSFIEAFTRSARNSWVSIGAIAVAIAVTLPALYRSVGSSMEEGFMLVFPEQVMKGLLPNVDFLHLYGPGSLQALASWFRVFGVSLASERTFGLLQHVTFVAGLVVLTRPWGRVVSTVVGLSSLLFVLTPIGLQALAWNGALALGVWSLVLSIRATHRHSRLSWISAGGLAGLALTFRPDIVLALGLGIGFLLWRRNRREFQQFATGLVVGLAPLWWHIVRAGPRAVVEGIFLDPVFHLRPGRELPRPPSLDHLDGALQVISEKFAPWWGFPHLTAPQQLFIWFFLLPAVALGVLVVARTMPRHRPERPVLMAAALFGVGLLPQAVQRPDSAHFLWVSAVSWPLAIVALVEMTRRRSPRSHPRAQILVATTAFALVVGTLVPFYTVRTYGDLAVRSLTGQLDVRAVRRDDRVFYLGDERPWRATLEVVEDLDSLIHEGDRLFVGPVDLRQTAYSDVFFYHLFPEAIPSTYYIEMDPGLANRDPRLASDVESSDWLVLTRFWSGWIEPNASIDFGSDLPNQIVEEHFCLHKSYQNDLVRLYRKCPQGDGIGPYEGPYRPEHDYAVEVLVPVPPRPDGTCTPTCRGKPSASGVEIGIDTSVVD